MVSEQRRKSRSLGGQVRIRYFAVILALGMPLRSSIAGTVAMSADQILSRVQDSYAHMNTYQDEGSVDTTFYDLPRTKEKNRELKVFKTAFIRGVKFKFEYANQTVFGPKSRYLIFSDFKESQSWWELTGKTQKGNLKMLLAEAGGVSSGSSYRVPIMLLAETSSAKIVDLRDGVLGATEKIDGNDCVKITGTSGQKQKTCYWIDANLFVVRKIQIDSDFDREKLDLIRKRALKRLKGKTLEEYSKHPSEEFSAKEITTYKPQVGVDLDDAKIVFDPN